MTALVLSRGLWLALLLGLCPGDAGGYQLRKGAAGKVLIWESREPTVEIDTSAIPKLKGAAKALRAAFSAWRAAGVPIAVRSKLGEGAPVAADGRNVLSFVPSGWSFGDEVVAMTISIHREQDGTIRETDIVFNAQHLTWSTDPTPSSGSFDIQNAATHEAGHFLGMDHEPARHDAVMYPVTLPAEIQKRELPADDREGASALAAAILAASKADDSEEIGAPLGAEGGCGGGGDLAFAGLCFLPWLPRSLRVPRRSRAVRRLPGALLTTLALVLGLALLAASPAQASIVRPLTLAGLVRSAEVVAEGRVVGMYSYREAGWILTDYLVAVGRCHRGACAQGGKTITIRTPGGRVDGLVMEVAGMPRIAIGTELLIFGRRYGGAVVPIGLASGLLRVEGAKVQDGASGPSQGGPDGFTPAGGAAVKAAPDPGGGLRIPIERIRTMLRRNP